MNITAIKTMTLMLVFGLSVEAHAQSLSLEQVLQRSVDHQISLKIARMQQQRAALEADKIQSMLGWNIGAGSGYNHDVGFTGAPADKVTVSANANRMLANGDSLSARGQIAYEDSEFAFTGFPNPNLTSQWTASYRKPLWQGKANPAYAQGLKSAAASDSIAQHQIRVTRDQIASQVVDLYFNLISTNKQIANLKSGQKRTQRLLDYIKGNEKLGLAEARDILQATAQLRSLRAETKAIQVSRQRLVTGLNRLMGRNLDAVIEPEFQYQVINGSNTAALTEMATAYDPRIQIRQAQIDLAQAAIERGRDQRKNKLDTLFSLGLRTSNGDATAFDNSVTSVSEQDWAGAVSVEYQRSMDTRGKDAVIQQAMLDKDIALQEIKSIQEIIQYDVEGLLSERDVTEAALNAYKDRLTSEKAKLKEGEQRYRKGRADTQQLILFENDLNTAQLMVTQQQIEQTRNQARLSLLTGQVWQNIKSLQEQGGGKPE